MDEQNTLDFSLDDIIREFSDAPTTEEIMKDPAAAEATEDVPPAEQDDDSAAKESAPVTGDTIRLDTASFSQAPYSNKDVCTDDTISIPDVPTGDTITIPDVSVEILDDDWKPESSEEYVPPQPIIFRPRSRLRELKKKLVTGPEQQYYALSEKGLGRLQAAIFFSVLMVLICAASTLS